MRRKTWVNTSTLGLELVGKTSLSRPENQNSLKKKSDIFEQLKLILYSNFTNDGVNILHKEITETNKEKIKIIREKVCIRKICHS